MSGKPSFFVELKRRHVYRVAIAYAVTAWLLLQLAAIVLPTFGAPGWVLKVLIGVFVVCFPIAVLLAWAFEVTPEGVRHTLPESEEPVPTPARRRAGRRIDFAIIAILVAAVAVLAWRQFLHRPQTPPVTKAVNVAPASSTAARAAIVSPRAAAIPEKSVAVLPFVNEGGDKDQQYFSDGLSEDFITALSQFAGLKVISRDSSFQFRDSKESAKTIGGKLGVAHLLEGSVSREGDEVRITAELVNAADGSILWSQHYDQPYKNLFALQDDITKAVAGVLKAKLLTETNGTAVVQSDRPPSDNLAAYTAFLRGRADAELETETGKRNAIAQFDEAIRLDPRYALAYAAASNAWQSLAATFDTRLVDQRRDISHARTAADMALQLNPDLAAAHGTLAGLMAAFDFNWTGALAESERAVELAPGTPAAKFNLANIQARLGHLKTAIELDRQALVRAPLSAVGYFGLGRKLSGLGQLDEAETALRRSIELAPGASRPYAYLAIIEVQRGDAAATLAAAQKTPLGFWHDFAVALALQIGANRVAADAALKNLIEKDSGNAAYQIAEVYAVRRDPDNMFKWLDHAWSNDDAGVELLLFDPLILRYKDDPRFAAFCRKVGLPTTTDAKAMP